MNLHVLKSIPNSKQHKEDKFSSKHLLVKLQTANDKKKTLKTIRT